MKHERISVTNLAFYAENPDAFCKAGGKPYNAKAAKIGERDHGRVGKLPSKVLYAVMAVAAIAIYLYLFS